MVQGGRGVRVVGDGKWVVRREKGWAGGWC